MPSYAIKSTRRVLKGDYTEVGNFAKISNGVASGFSASQYLVIPENMDVTSNKTWEIHTKFVYKAVDGSDANIFAGEGNQYIIFWVQKSTHKIVFNIGNGSTWVTGDVFSTTALQEGKTYYYKLVYDGSSITQYLSENGTNWTNEGSYTGSVSVPSFRMRIGIARGTVLPFAGSIDLSQSYININEERWWSGDSYTKVGSWIDDYEASGFSASSYLKTPKTFPAPTNRFEAKAKVVTPSAFGECNIIYYCGGSFAIQHETDVSVSAISFWIYKAGTGFERVISVPSTTLLATSTPYWFKVTWDGSVYNLLYSTDDESYTSVGTYASTTPLLSSGTVAVGLNDQASKYPYLGSIDLNNSYIKINDELWWTGTKLVPENKYYVFRRKKSRYYKDIVTTKYWKEVTTGSKELEYACYSITTSGMTAYSYAKVPLGSDMKIYTVSGGFGLQQATTSSELAQMSNLVYSSLTEDQAKSDTTYLRYTTGDLYKDTTTTTVVEGTAEDYTYTTTEETTIEVSANDDYDRVESGGESTYVIKRLEETKIYMKYVYQNWAQPVLTSNTSSSKMSLSATSTYNTTYAMWKAFDNSSSTAWLSADGTGSGSLRVKFPTNLFISKIAVTGWSNPNGATKTVTIYKDTTNTNVIGAAHTFNGSGTYTWNFSNPVETNALSFHAVGTGKWGCIGEIKITAQERITTVGTPDDYDYIVTV